MILSKNVRSVFPCCFIIIIIACFTFFSCTGKKSRQEINLLFPQFVDALFQDDFDRAGKIFLNIIKSFDSLYPEKVVFDFQNPIILHSIAQKLNDPHNYVLNNLNTFLPLSTKTDIELDDYELKYLRNTLILKQLSDSICRGAENDLEKVRLIMNWIFYHVYPHKPISVEEPIGAFPYGILERGFGLCDRMSWLFCALAQQQGIKSSVVYLYPPKGDSNHTIVQVMLEEPFLVDPQNCIFFNLNNKLIGLKQINSQPSLVQRFQNNISIIRHTVCEFSTLYFQRKIIGSRFISSRY